jgi:hypothetical protein
LEIDSLERQQALAADLENEIGLLRVMLRRALQIAGKPKNTDDAMRILDLFGLTASRISRLLLKQKELRILIEQLARQQAINEAISSMDFTL